MEESRKFIVRFLLEETANSDERIIIVGSDLLGNWNPENGWAMNTIDGKVWSARVVLCADFKYRYVKLNKKTQKYIWDTCSDRKIDTSNSEQVYLITIHDRWNLQDGVTTIKTHISSPKMAIVVLGKKLLPSGKPSAILINRVKEASNQFRNQQKLNKDVDMILTGGIVQEGEGIRPEADVMAQLAIENGVPQDNLILESQARNTIQNAIYTRDILEERGISNVLIITSDFHMPRTKKFFDAVLADSIIDFSISYYADVPQIPDKDRNAELKNEGKLIQRVDGVLKAFRIIN